MADLQKTVLVMLPSEEEDKESVCLFNLEAKRVQSAKEFINSRFVGSSHGWLGILDETADPYLFNPLSETRIQLPTKETFPHILGVSEKRVGDSDDFVVKYIYGGSCVCRLMTAKELQYNLVSKAILNADPSSSSSKNNYVVVVIYSPESKLAFCNQGDNAWKAELNAKYPPYGDIMCNNNQLFALSESGLIEVWDIDSTCPVKTMEIQPSFPSKMAETWRSLRDLYSSRWYLVESSGDLLLVSRHVGEFVRDDNTPVYEADLLIDEDESLSDRVLFLGANHSMSLSAVDFPECKKNSIYFTDDYWERMNEDYSYGGHDLGVFNLGDASVEPIYEFDTRKIEPPPVWIVPSPFGRE
ncbi:hypothetical protein F0562_006584 [Nyssa sinensis]|uniref:KIB1-4 beta-propeller domain-containing protein n=1 Tax=Nyssa sinensis TaxID=561372 RepID=A0A5J5AN89_9ASTE|nr:hypothetical protein F0562_006584 [Nyssa sinensis]